MFQSCRIIIRDPLGVKNQLKFTNTAFAAYVAEQVIIDGAGLCVLILK
jgi:hypothetical protein